MIHAYICHGGELCGVTNMFDELGDELDLSDLEHANSIVYQTEDGLWHAAEVEPSALYRPN